MLGVAEIIAMATTLGSTLSVKDNLEQQINEIELLQSVYSMPGEFKIDDEAAFTLAGSFINGLSVTHPSTLSYTVHLTVSNEDEEQYNIITDICCRIQNTYPADHPEVYIRSDNFSRTEQDRFNKDLVEYMRDELVPNEVCMYPIIEWVKQEVINYCAPLTNQSSTSGNDLVIGSEESEKFCRMWLYMHHIYSKIKRRNILALSKDYNLSGFCLPGKPGVVCIEGTVFNTNEFYGQLRRWNWKSITCRKRDPGNESAATIDSQRRFKGFQELSFDVHGPRGNHLDLGQFRQYMLEHGKEHMFKELFGLEGK